MEVLMHPQVQIAGVSPSEDWTDGIQSAFVAPGFQEPDFHFSPTHEAFLEETFLYFSQLPD